MRNFLAGIGAAFCVFVALAVGYIVGGGSLGDNDNGGGGNSSRESGSESEPQLRATILALSDPQVTATPTAPAVTDIPATATPNSQTAGSSALPDRTNCDEIYGTQYRSEREKQFFLSTCVSGTGGNGGATGPTGPATDTAPTQAVPPTTGTNSQANNRFTWGGSGGEYIAFSSSLCQSGTVGYTVSGEYSGRSFCTATRVQGMPPFTCPDGAEARVQEATAGGATIGEVFCITPFTPTPPPGG